MKHNKNISTLEILQEYPCSGTFIGIDNLNLEGINEALENDSGFRLKTLDADYVHIYNNCIVILVKLFDTTNMFVFTQEENVSNEVIQARRKLFFDSISPINY